MSDRLRCWLLCEDVEQENFFRPLLEMVFGNRSVHVEPRRRPGGASFVLAQLPGLIVKVRRKAQELVGLVVVIDGDTFGHVKRREEIRSMLFRSGLSTIDESERIVVCVPCRNIETWELWLCTAADDLNERDDHKKRWQATAARTKDAVEAWFMTQSEPRATLEKAILPALADARTQIRRLKESVNR